MHSCKNLEIMELFIFPFVRDVQGRESLNTVMNCCFYVFKFCLLRWSQLVCFCHSLIDYQNTRQFIYCLSGNQILLCCRSLDWSVLINSLLLQTQGAGRGQLIKERTSEMVNKLGLDSAGDAQSVLAAGDVLAHQWLQVLLSDPLGHWKQTHEGGMLKSRETLWYQNASFLYQPCV